MSDRLTDHQVGYLAALTIHPVCVLAREVQASRKLIADLRALPYTAIATDLLAQMIEGAGL